jgi:hypothetical protein
MLSIVNEHDRFMNNLQLLNGRVDILERKAARLNAVVLAKDSSITDLKQSLFLEIEAGELCESDLEGVKRKLRQEKTQKTIFAGTTVALIGAVLWLAISN